MSSVAVSSAAPVDSAPSVTSVSVVPLVPAGSGAPAGSAFAVPGDSVVSVVSAGSSVSAGSTVFAWSESPVAPSVSAVPAEAMSGPVRPRLQSTTSNSPATADSPIEIQAQSDPAVTSAATTNPRAASTRSRTRKSTVNYTTSVAEPARRPADHGGGVSARSGSGTVQPASARGPNE